MDQNVLLQEVRSLFNSACQEVSAGHKDQALAHLVKLRELLNSQPELEAGGDQVLEEKLYPDDG